LTLSLNSTLYSGFRLEECRLSKSSCAALVSALKSNPSHLTELDLRCNNLHSSDVQQLQDLSNWTPGPAGSLPSWSLCGVQPETLRRPSNPSHLTELDLSYSILEDSSMKVLCSGLESPNCRLQTLRSEHCSCWLGHRSLPCKQLTLSNTDFSTHCKSSAVDPIPVNQLTEPCGLSETDCEIVASALNSNPSHLTELDLSNNSLKDSSMKFLCSGLESPNCRLQTLRLIDCSLSEISCEVLGLALKKNLSNLTELDLSRNQNLRDSGVVHLCGFLESPDCRLQTLRSVKNLSEISCEALGSALKKNPSNLKELDLSRNQYLQDSGVLHLCGFLESPDCRLQTLRLKRCSLSDISCEVLVSALKKNPSNLKELDLSGNNLRDSGVPHLCGFLESPDCRLQTLRSVKKLNLKDAKKE
uniref:NACHT LRR and PYD domain-containing protein n=1 Tax=Oryzias latipes TaxID=8090 RepID=A0A3P9HT95_ORYLA